MSHDIKAVVESYLNTADMCRIFDCTPMTIYLWRREKQMPSIEIDIGKKHLILYDWEVVKPWADEHNKVIVHPPKERTVLVNV